MGNQPVKGYYYSHGLHNYDLETQLQPYLSVSKRQTVAMVQVSRLDASFSTLIKNILRRHRACLIFYQPASGGRPEADEIAVSSESLECESCLQSLDIGDFRRLQIFTHHGTLSEFQHRVIEYVLARPKNIGCQATDYKYRVD